MSEEEFKAAVAFSTSPANEGMDSSNETKLELYALFKQATAGPATGSAPSRLKVVERAKWMAWNGSSVVLKVRKLGYNEELQVHEKELLENVSLLVSYFYPAQDADLMDYLSATYPKLSVMAMDCVPRITRAQKLDSLSSMANIAGYRAVAEAFGCFQRCPKAQVTAAGKLPPAKVFIIGCGVAGLSAIGYCKSMGCVVRAFDTRPAAKEQAESLGAEFLTVNVTEDGSGMGGYAKEMSEAYKTAQNDMTIKACRDSDIVITTALIPGRPAPNLADLPALQKYDSTKSPHS